MCKWRKDHEVTARKIKEHLRVMEQIPKVQACTVANHRSDLKTLVEEAHSQLMELMEI